MYSTGYTGLTTFNHLQMKVKQLILGLSVAVLFATTQFACDSKKENKAEEVQEEKKDVIEAQRDGDSKEDVMEEQADLDSARKDYKEAVKDSIRKQ
jgi:urease gamma subunit